MEYKKFMEALTGKQHKLDKNKNGKLDAHDFKLLRKEEDECEYDDMDEAVERVARADYKVSPSGRKTHREITFKDGSPEDEESKKVSEEVESDYLLEYPEDLQKMKKADSYKVGDKIWTKVGSKWHPGHITTPLNKAGNHGVKFQHGGKTHSYVSSPDQLRLHVEELELDERTMSDAEMKKREDIVKGMKKNVAGFKAKYGDRAKEVMYATATKMAMKEESELEEQAPVAPSLVKHRIGVTVSEPDHPMVSKRKEKVQKFVIVTHSSNKEGAKAVGEKFYKKKGYRVHDSHHAGMVNEEVDQLDELSKKTVSSYLDKTKSGSGRDSATHIDKSNKAYERGAMNSADMHDRIASNRIAGSAAAKKRLNKEAKKEDLPFDPPYKKAGDGNVKDKSGAVHTPMSRARDLARQAMKKQMKEGFDIDITDEQADTLIEAANLEQLDELSKGTLSSYVKKSSSKQFAAGHKAATADSGTEMKAINKAQKRSQGVAEGRDNPLQDIGQNAWHLIQGDKPIAINFPDEARARSFHSGHGYGKETKVLHGSQVRRNAYLKHNPGVINWPEHSKGVAKAVDRLTREDIDFDDEGNLVAEKLSFNDFLIKINEQLLEYEAKSGVYRHKGSYGSSYQGSDDEDDEDDKPKKAAAPAEKRGRGRPAGSYSGSYKARSAETKAAAAAKAAATKAANKK